MTGKRAAETGEYRECAKNHAFETLGTCLDGCQRFRLKGTGKTRACKNCGCSRDFHRFYEFPARIVKKRAMPMFDKKQKLAMKRLGEKYKYTIDNTNEVLLKNAVLGMNVEWVAFQDYWRRLKAAYEKEPQLVANDDVPPTGAPTGGDIPAAGGGRMDPINEDEFADDLQFS